MAALHASPEPGTNCPVLTPAAEYRGSATFAAHLPSNTAPFRRKSKSKLSKPNAMRSSDKLSARVGVTCRKKGAAMSDAPHGSLT